MPIRQPSSPDSLYDWHRAAMRGLRPPVVEDEPQCGWFRTRLVANGPFVPARIRCVQVVDLEGELTEPERLIAEVGLLSPRDAARAWLSLASKPISEAHYHDLMHRLVHGSPHERATHAPVDLLDQFRNTR